MDPEGDLSRTIRRRAPAKINLCLLIRGRRADGYHLLESLVTPVTLYDHVEVSFAPARVGSVVEVTSDSADAPGGSTNIAHRAASSLLEEAGVSGRATIDLRKQIPVGSGLGGGSSDAATVLRALNELIGSPVSPPRLQSIGATLGADVPLFLNGGASIIEGIGERVSSVNLPRIELVLCSDRKVLSTKEVFSRLDLSLTSGNRPSNIRAFIEGTGSLSELLYNDLEAAAAILHPEVLTIKKRLREAGSVGTLMTGSGSAVFGVCADQIGANGIAAEMRQMGYWAEAVSTCEGD